jgi:hypothetical protein
LCCWYTGPNDIGRIQCGPETDLSWELLEILVKGITGEAFIPKSLIPPQGIPPLCDDPGLRSVVLSWLPTLDESGVAAVTPQVLLRVFTQDYTSQAHHPCDLT